MALQVTPSRLGGIVWFLGKRDILTNADLSLHVKSRLVFLPPAIAVPSGIARSGKSVLSLWSLSDAIKKLYEYFFVGR